MKTYNDSGYILSLSVIISTWKQFLFEFQVFPSIVYMSTFALQFYFSVNSQSEKNTVAIDNWNTKKTFQHLFTEYHIHRVTV